MSKLISGVDIPWLLMPGGPKVVGWRSGSEAKTRKLGVRERVRMEEEKVQQGEGRQMETQVMD